MPYTIRTMAREDVGLAIDWAAKEGWNPGIHDATCFHAADEGGFLIAELDEEPVATVSAVRYGDSYGFLGFYIVKPEFRGRGFGFPILKAAMERMSGSNIGLDGVVEQQRNYMRLGFRMAYNNIRFEGRRTGEIFSCHPKIVPLNTLPFQQLCDFDNRFFFERRESFLKPWISQPETIALGFVTDDILEGYGVIRPCRVGYKIGPLFAENETVAQELFHALINEIEIGSTFYLDIPEPNREARRLVREHNMQKVFETARMYTGKSPDLPLDRIFGVTSFELG